MANLVINAELREKAGKGSSRALRRSDLIPAVIYGDKKEPVMITLKRNEIQKELNKGGFLSKTVTLKVGKDSQNVLPRDVQFHPVSDWPLHVDFLRLGKGATINIMVPVHFMNQETCAGIKAGGILNVVRHEVEFACPADAIPEFIEADIESLEIGDSVHISTVKLPKGVVAMITDRDFTIATISAPSALKSTGLDDEEAEEGEDEAAPTEEAAE
jgi:large subunit ribosomal protein L25